jgi:hypothetical protein
VRIKEILETLVQLNKGANIGLNKDEPVGMLM